MKQILVSILFAAAACGGSKSPPPAEPAPAPVAEPTPTEPPPEPAKPEEPPPPDPAQVKADLMTAETGAYEKAKPVFEKFCQSCHAKGQKTANAKKLKALDIAAYPFTGKHAKPADIRKVLGAGGEKPTMPKGKPGSVKGDDLGAITGWADAWDAAEAGGAHEAAAAPAAPAP